MRDYSLELLNIMKAKSYVKDMDGLSVLVKPVPDALDMDVMDDRAYKESKSALVTQYLVPKFYHRVRDSVMEKIQKVATHKASISIHNRPVIKKCVEVNGCDMYVYSPTTSFKKLPIVYFVHGGGYWAGSTEVIEDALKLLVSEYNVIAFSMDYGLAPMFPVPTGHLDCKAGLDWVFEHGNEFGGDVDKLVVAGDSAGGNIAIYLSEDRRVKGQILLYPSVAWSDDSLFDINKYEINKKQGRVIHASIMNFKKSLDLMFKVVDSSDPLLFPLHYEVKRQLPSFMALGAFDVLRFEGLAYASKLDKVRVVFYEGISHAFIDKVGVLPQSEDCIYEMGDFIMDVVGEL